MNYKKIFFETTIYCSIIFILLLFKFDNIYPIYGSHLFQDWIYILIYSSNDCAHSFVLSDFNPDTDCKEILNTNFVYPKIWLYITKFISNNFVYELTIIFLIIVFIFINLILLKNISIYSKLIFIFSPVSILLFQRGNNDIVIFILIYLFSILLINNKKILLSLIPLSLSILLKLYAISVIPIFLTIKKRNKFFIFVSILSFSIFLLLVSDFLNLTNIYNKSGLKLAFSSSVYLKIINSTFDVNFDNKIFSIIFLILIILTSIFFKSKIPNVSENNEINFLIGSSIIVSSFFLNEGYLYKLIFLSFTLPLLYELKTKFNLKIYKYFLWIVYLSLWIEFSTYIIEFFFSIEYSAFKQNPYLELKNIIFGTSIILKHMIFWLLNINLIFLSTKIFTKKLIKYF